MVIGLAFGPQPSSNPQADARARDIGSAFVQQFLDVHGTTRCKDLQTALVGWNLLDRPNPAAWRAANGSTACSVLSAETARMDAALILEHTDQD